MKTIVITLLALAVIITGFNIRGVFSPGMVKADSITTPTSDKYDGDCTGHETVGRCADKCPANTSEGVYYLQGFDKDTGAAVCGFSYFHPCPYADAQPADSAVCQKLTDQNTQKVVQSDPDPTTTGAVDFTGK